MNSFFYRILVAVFKISYISRNQSNIYEGAFFAKTVNAHKPLTIFTKKTKSQIFDWVLNTPL